MDNIPDFGQYIPYKLGDNVVKSCLLLDEAIDICTAMRAEGANFALRSSPSGDYCVISETTWLGNEPPSWTSYWNGWMDGRLSKIREEKNGS